MEYTAPPDESPQRANELATLMLKLLVNVQATRTLSFTALTLAFVRLCQAMGKERPEMKKFFHRMLQEFPDTEQERRFDARRRPNTPAYIQEAQQAISGSARFRHIYDVENNQINMTL